ncbi:MAG: phage tail tape measure protein [Hyphomicrobiaceae bacterium]
MANTTDPTAPNALAGLADDAALAAANLDRVVDGQRQLSAELTISERQASQFGRALTSAFVGLAVQGKSVGDVVRSLALSLSRLALNAAFKPLNTLIGNGITGLISGGLGANAPAFTASGALAAPSAFPVTLGAGQDPAAGLARIGGAVSASAQMTPSAGPIVFNVTTPDAESFRRSETQLAAMLNRAVSQGQRNL